MTISSIPTAAVVALQESTTQMDFAAGDGRAMAQDYAMYVQSPPWLFWDLIGLLPRC